MATTEGLRTARDRADAWDRALYSLSSRTPVDGFRRILDAAESAEERAALVGGATVGTRGGVPRMAAADTGRWGWGTPQWGRTALRAACGQGNEALVRWLLGAGADVEARDRVSGRGCQAGSGRLHAAGRTAGHRWAWRPSTANWR